MRLVERAGVDLGFLEVLLVAWGILGLLEMLG